MSVKSGAAYLIAALLAVAPTVASAASSDTAPSGNTPSKTMLAPGGAAGLKKAQGMSDNTLLWVGGAVVVAGGIALVAGNNGSHHHTSTTTGTIP